MGQAVLWGLQLAHVGSMTSSKQRFKCPAKEWPIAIRTVRVMTLSNATSTTSLASKLLLKLLQLKSGSADVLLVHYSDCMVINCMALQQRINCIAGSQCM